ncbi:DUF134 domain-containing protein [Methanothermobacter wolfeii]|uniref:UPF0251 protein U2150_01430 n=1 Tax=Methanothermobacter wolfeii TaxID=145261 RepID=A0ABU8TTX7_METWO|nr:DUF134 domain-containing protein [Methanothermobacter wolfeii]MDI6702148.1 DUF134 domain-containing protein [Methanothermobacter wolfeii]NLM02065.1 DUF134 domain-containing protein [Methanothermobacter wolfeii]QHN06893.1 DUF134 domain-containing protein [Methanothermobacter sp. THM-1]
MPRPRRRRRILGEPQVASFSPESSGSCARIEITLDEFEAIRLRDYHGIQQKKAAEIMGISQPTFHRALKSARSKVAEALVEGRPIILKGGDYIMDRRRYKCMDCQFEWISPGKSYEKCPDCGSENITSVSADTLPRAGRGPGRGFGAGRGAPRVCKCIECGYEAPKTPGIPCRTEKCPKCGAPMCGSD